MIKLSVRILPLGRFIVTKYIQVGTFLTVIAPSGKNGETWVFTGKRPVVERPTLGKSFPPRHHRRRTLLVSHRRIGERVFTSCHPHLDFPDPYPDFPSLDRSSV